ncbi:MAG TPA: hypothetical protein QGF05_10025, partial [Dehalococcoidia bacterium]|nr:hypothetical protein [Dehalococcoidia bacterium]
MAFLPPHDSRASDIRAACDALDIPSIGLRPEELVESGVLTPAHFPIVVHTGSERYIRTVQEPGDAERALTRYLKAGGTMLVLGARRPFSFADDLPSLDPKALNATLFWRTFGLDCLAPGDARGGAEAFDDRPDGDLAFRLEAGQSVFSRLPERMPFPSGDDHPFRPAVGELLSVDDEFRPLITLYDADGHRFGPAAALITRNSGGYAGTNVLWVWGPLVTDAFAHAESLIYQSLAAAAEMCGAASMVPPVPTEAQSAGATIAVLPLADVDRAGMIQDIGREMNADIGTVTEDVLADRTAFTADRYPIAIHAPKTEHYVKSWRLPNDGADAYKRYLDEGGFLIACGNGTQFSVASEYSDGQLRDVRSVRPEMGLAMGLPLMPGFEQPRGEMFLRQAPGQTVFANLIEPIHVTKITDKRWRGLAPTRGVGTEFIP